MTSSLKKIFASFTRGDWSHGDDVLITDEQDAVQKALQARAIVFSTFEVETVILGGKELKGDPENFSPRRYVGIDKVYTKAEVLADIAKHEQEDIRRGSPAFTTAQIQDVFKKLRDVFNTSACDAYITGLERDGEYISLKDGEKVFNRKGAQIWPKL